MTRPLLLHAVVAALLYTRQKGKSDDTKGSGD